MFLALLRLHLASPSPRAVYACACASPETAVYLQDNTPLLLYHIKPIETNHRKFLSRKPLWLPGFARVRVHGQRNNTIPPNSTTNIVCKPLSRFTRDIDGTIAIFVFHSAATRYAYSLSHVPVRVRISFVEHSFACIVFGPFEKLLITHSKYMDSFLKRNQYCIRYQSAVCRTPYFETIFLFWFDT